MFSQQASVHTTKKDKLQIEGISNSIILRYFETLNAGEFDATSELFAIDGVMYAPFEAGIIGPKAIATYLKEEAQQVKAYPREGISETLDENQIKILLAGKAQTSWCGVNVSWLFILNQQQEILYTKIKLLASAQELLALRKSS